MNHAQASTEPGRAAFTRGLRELADWLDANPDIRLSTSAYLLTHYQEFADSVEAALTVTDLDDMARLARIVVAHAQLTEDIR
jgi:hypothetical protein